MSALFNLDDVKLLYAASQIPDDDGNTTMPKMQFPFSKSKDKKKDTVEEDSASEEEHEEDSESSGDEVVAEEEEEEESDDLLEELGEAADKLAQAMTDQFFPKQFKVKIQSIRLQNLERRKRDVLVQFQVGVPADKAQEGGLFAEEFADEQGEEGAEVEGEGKKGKRKGKPEASAAAKAKTLGTEVVEKLERGRTNVFKRKFSTVWTGGYALLPEQALAVVLVERNRFGGSSELDRVQLNLEHLAGGSIQQEVTFAERDGRHVLETYRCQFQIYFQETFLYQIKFVDWQGENLQAADADGASDPYLEWSIRPNRKLWFKKGGYRGRSTRTEHQSNTTHPTYREGLKPLFYYGTRADLENELLRIRVMDFDAGSSNDCIGFTEIPLRGVLQGGRLSASLCIWQDPARKKVSKLIPAGTVKGGIELISEPKHAQFGDVVTRLPNTTYLAVHIVRCVGLKAGDADGSADPYVTVTWDQTSQQTRVLRNSRSPLFEETLYFPVKLVRITKEAMEKLGDITIFVLDYDPNGADNLGFYKLGLDQVTNSAYRRLEKEGIKTRVFEHDALPLAQPGLKHTVGTMHLQAYFTPDLPDEVKLDPVKDGPTPLDTEFRRREKRWRGKVPQRLSSRGKYLATATDETNTVRFLPTYLCKCPPPRDVTDPMSIARMVHCVTFQADPHQVEAQNQGLSDGVMELWSSPNYFMDVKKGASEDHAILQANLFLGMGLDAYIAIGRLPGGITQHVWVVTRESNGDVRLWETTKGIFYTLPQRWKGLFMDGADVGTLKEGTIVTGDTPQPKSKEPHMHKRAKKKSSGAGEMDPRKIRAALSQAQDRAAREAATKKKETEARHKQEKKLLYLDEQEMWTVEADLNPFETPRGMDTTADGAARLRSSHAADGHTRSLLAAPPGKKQTGGSESKVALKDALRKVSMEQKAAGILDRLSLEAKSGFKGPEVAAEGGAEEEEVITGFALPPELQLKLCEPLPYESLEVLINAENVWANIQAYNVTALGFDLNDEARWHPFILPGTYDPPPPRPFYSTGRVAAKLPAQRLAALTATLTNKLRAEYTSWRVTRSMKMKFSSKVQSVLEEGLALLEAARCSSSSGAQIEVDKWRGRLMSSTPPDHHFRGRALTFSTTDVDEIVEHIMGTYPYHEEAHRDATFAIAVATFPHYCAVTAMWVYIAVIVPHKDTSEGQDAKEQEVLKQDKAKKKAKAADEKRKAAAAT